AVVAVWVMQVAVDDVVDVIAVGYRLVAAARAVDVIGRVGAAVVARGAGGGILRIDIEPVLVHVVAVRVVQVTVVHVVDVVVVANRRVPAARAVLVVVIVV